MSRKELFKYCTSLYRRNGIKAVTYHALSKQKGLYESLYQNGLTQKVLLETLGIIDEYKKYKLENFKRVIGGKTQRRWTWGRVMAEAKVVMEREAFLPPAGWFSENGNGSLVQAVYSLGKTWADLRHELGSFHGGAFVLSRNEMRWKSHPEASLSNFLYARGVIHKVGGKYPEAFARLSGQKYGYYDLHFLDHDGDWIDVEIWGDRPHGHQEEEYARKRLLKESFNLSRDTFLGIQYQDCFSEKSLTEILEPYIGTLEPFVFDKPLDRKIPSTHWSNADELIEYCREFIKQIPDRKFPTEEWLRKRGKWNNRPGPTYNTLSVYIKKWIGGIRRLREILGQGKNSTEQWNNQRAIAEYKNWYMTYGITPGTARTAFRRGQLSISAEECKRATRICHAVLKYAGGEQRVQAVLGIKPKRRSKWSIDNLVQTCKELHEQYGMTPSQLCSRYKSGGNQIPRQVYVTATQLIDASTRHCESLKNLYHLAGIARQPKRAK